LTFLLREALHHCESPLTQPVKTMNAPFKPAENASLDQTFAIEGMTCASCVRRVEQAIEKLPGVASAVVNLATETAHVTYEAPVAPEAVPAAIRQAGYEVRTAAADFIISGMTCASCVRRVEKAIAAVPGVTRASVNLATERAHVETSGALPSAAIIEAAAGAGYEARLVADAAQPDDRQAAARAAEQKALARDVLIATALTLPLFIMEMAVHFLPGFHHALSGVISQQTIYTVYFALAGLVQFGPGLRFYRKGVPALLRGAPDMNALVVLGSTACRHRQRVLRGFCRHYHAHPARALSRSPRQGPDERSDQAAGRPAGKGGKR
jgi:Cu+-exporting ATPase